jgi:multiple sugar transport system permease protein
MMPVLLIYKYSGAEYGSFYGYASAMAIVLGIIIAILTALNFWVSRKWVHYES